jgi:23S rRNA (guanosine2251-2'-O)-methyltransferase
MAPPRHEYIHGINAAFEVLRAGRRETKAAYLARASRENPRLKKLAGFCERKGVPVEWVDKSRLVELSKTREHQGVVLKSKPYPYVTFSELARHARLLLLDNVEDPHNVGAILRSAEVFGFHDILLPLKGTPEVYPSVVKVSAGASEHLRIAREMNANRYVSNLKEDGVTILALDAAGETPLDDLGRLPLDRVLLVIGGEAKAVGRYILREAHHRVSIRQKGRVNSLNASVAASIAMHQLDAILTRPGE